MVAAKRTNGSGKTEDRDLDSTVPPKDSAKRVRDFHEIFARLWQKNQKQVEKDLALWKPQV